METCAEGVGPIVYWYLTYKCNLACKHCWVNASPQRFDEEELATGQLVEAAGKISGLHPRLVVITGGEPLMCDDFGLVLDSLLKFEVPLFLETNALLLNKEIVGKLSRAVQSGLLCRVGVSLDGGDAETHEWIRGPQTFAKTIVKIEQLCRLGIPTSVQCTLNKVNMRTIAELFGLAKRIGLEKRPHILAFSPTFALGRGKTTGMGLGWEKLRKALHEISVHLDKYKGEVFLNIPPGAMQPATLMRIHSSGNAKYLVGCSFPTLGVLPGGEITVCTLTSLHDDLCFGNVMTGKLREIITEKLNPLWNQVKTSALRGVCSTCVFVRECRGGCRALAYSSTGDFLAPNPLCEQLDREGQFPIVFKRSTTMRHKRVAI